MSVDGRPVGYIIYDPVARQWLLGSSEVPAWTDDHGLRPAFRTFQSYAAADTVARVLSKMLRHEVYVSGLAPDA